MEMTGRALKGALSVMATVSEAENIRVRGDGFFGVTDQLRSASTEAQAEGSGSILVGRDMLTSKASSCLPDGLVTLREVGAALEISQGKSRWKIPFPPEAPYPDDMLSRLPGNSVKIAARAFLRAIEQVSGACAQDDRNPALCGLQLDFRNGSVSAVDGVLMFWDSLPVGDLDAYIMPMECVAPIHKLFKECGELSISKDERWFSIEGGDVVYRAKMISEKFPEWKNFVPKNLVCSASCDREDFKRALEACSSINTKKGSGVHSGRVVVEGGASRISLRTENSLGEEGFSEFAIEGEIDVTRYASHRRLTSAIASLDCKSITVEFHDGQGTPIVIKDPGKPDAGRMALCMHG